MVEINGTVLITAFVSIIIFVSGGILYLWKFNNERIYKITDALTLHDTEQANRTNSIEVNYLDRFAEVNKNITSLERSTMKELNEIKKIITDGERDLRKDFGKMESQIATLQAEHEMMHKRIK